jgi:hypothetical protein
VNPDEALDDKAGQRSQAISRLTGRAELPGTGNNAAKRKSQDIARSCCAV